MEYVAELDRPETVQMRAVWIPLNLGERVVLPVNSDPLFRGHAGGNPQAESEDQRDRRVQVEGFMRGAAMEEDRRAEDRNLRDTR